MTGRTYKQLSREERLSIESDLNDPDIKLKTIAAHLNRDPKSIRYEVTHRAVVRVRSNQHNKCGLQDICTKVRLCPDCITGKCCECRHVYRAVKGRGIERADRPADLLKRSLVTPSLLAGILNYKYVNSLPLNRIEQEFKRNGFNLNREVMCSWVIRCTERDLSLIHGFPCTAGE